MFDLHAEAEEGTAADAERGLAFEPTRDALGTAVAADAPLAGERYVPSPIDASAFTGQIIAFAFIALAMLFALGGGGTASAIGARYARAFARRKRKSA